MRLARFSLTAACIAIVLGAIAPAATAKVSTSVTGNVLNIAGDEDADQVAVACVGGTAKVNDRDPTGGPIACSRIVEIDATTGGGDDVVDFSGITEEFGKAVFPGFGERTGAAAVTGLGNDRYIPSDKAFNLFFGEFGKDRATGGDVRDQLNGGPGNDRLRGGGGRDALIGNDGADRIFGGPGGDTISGNAGNDYLSGEEGGDVIGGGSGRDRLVGGRGRDRLIGGTGMDALRGGPGRDIEIQDPPKAPTKP